MKSKLINSPIVFSIVFSSVLFISAGCNTAYFKNQFSTLKGKTVETETVAVNEKAEASSEIEIVENVNDTVEQSTLYENEQEILEELYDNFDEAIVAHMDGNFGLAEQKLGNALLLFQQVNLNDIEDESLVTLYKDAAVLLAQEFGKILHESAIIAEEDPMAWLEDIDAEQFKAGKWTDAELEKIVMKIAITADVPIEFNEPVRNMINYFQNQGRADMAKWLKRSGRFIPMMQEILVEEGIPEDMVYHSMIESGYSPRAYSRARCVGLWQFMYATGKMYGLDRDQWVDERRDPVKSTRAAAKYLSDLFKSSDDWNIVMAMYNYGPTRVIRQLKQNENIEFWDLSLPRETRNHIPSFMAALVIAKAPELFGFENIEMDPPFEFDTVEVNGYTSLSTAAECAGCDAATLKELNPELLTDRVPLNVETYELRVPKGCGNTFTVEYAKLPVEKYVAPQVASVRVQSGDTFSGIADRYKISLSSLRAANPQITNINRLRVGQRINLTASAAVQQTINVNRDDAVGYTIQRNDTLGIIADRYKTTVRTLQALNNMGSSTRIYVGRTILIPKNSSSSSSSTAIQQTVDVNRDDAVGYMVQRNDTLEIIAKRYNTTIRTLQALNNMGSSTRIYAGRRILIPKNSSSSTSASTIQTAQAAGTGTISYVIRKGDTLYEIAQQYGVNYRTIMEINQIKDHRKIKPGDTIIIKR